MEYIIFIKRIVEVLVYSVRNFFSFRTKVFYIVENANWVIKHDGISIAENLKQTKSKITITSRGIRNSLIHFGSIHTFLNSRWAQKVHKSNKVIVTWFHIVGNEYADLIPTAINKVDLWHTACKITRNKMVKLGIPMERIKVIPLGVELGVFKESDAGKKEECRKKFKISNDKVVLGSFQKDGNGWGEGLEPKLIKGPDIFCEVVGELAKKFDVFVVLTGPARGYVKNRLTELKVPFIHENLPNPKDVSKYYLALDLYLVAAREEGGPKGLLEAWASGVPLVSTRVGMAPDIIVDGHNGFLAEIENVNQIADCCARVLEDKTLADGFREAGLDSVKNHDWSLVTNRYYNEMYRRFL